MRQFLAESHKLYAAAILKAFETQVEMARGSIKKTRFMIDAKPDLVANGTYVPRPYDENHAEFVKCSHKLIYICSDYDRHCSECNYPLALQHLRCDEHEYFSCEQCYLNIRPDCRSLVENH